MRRVLGRAAVATLSAGSVAAAPLIVNSLLRNSGGPLSGPVDAPPSTYQWRLGDIAYWTAGSGPPLLLLHGVGVGASSFEWQGLFSELAKSFQVFAVDLLGFGRSAHPALRHSGRFYTQLVDDFIRFIVKRPANVVASSHSCSYAIRLAFTRPERIGSLVLVCPAGLSGASWSDSQTRIGSLMNKPLIGETLYYALASRSNITRTLREELYWDAGLVTDSLVRQYYASAHAAGSSHAISAFLSGELDLVVEKEFRAIKQPVLLVWGADARYSKVENARIFQEANGNAHLVIVRGARQLPHAERPEEFHPAVVNWLAPYAADQQLRIIS